MPLGFGCPLSEEGGKGVFLICAVRASAFIARDAGIAFGARVTLDGFGCEDFAAGCIFGEGTNDVAGRRNGDAGGELGCDLQAIQIETGALVVEGRRAEGVHDLHEGSLNTLRVFERRETEGFLWTAFWRGGAAKAPVEITKRPILEGGRFAPDPARHDVTALVEHDFSFGKEGGMARCSRGRDTPTPLDSVKKFPGFSSSERVFCCKSFLSNGFLADCPQERS